jgi:CheY-like chemotaxis protein
MTADGSVLVIDDDADVRESIECALEDEGYEVRGASNGEEALRVLRERNVKPHVILLDMMMPVMDGWAFRAEQESDPALAAIPVLVFTAYGSPNEIAEQLHAAGYLRKPLRLADLVAAIERVRSAAPQRTPAP